MAKRKKKEHEKIRAHIEQAKRDKARNATYSSRTGCDNTTDSNKKAQEVATSLCIYAKYGCLGAKKHKTNRSRQCIFYEMTKEEIIGE